MDQALRETLGRKVREVQMAAYAERGHRGASPWDQLSEPEKEVDRRIGEALFDAGMDVAVMVCMQRAESERIYTPGPGGESHAVAYERAIEDIDAYREDARLRETGGPYPGASDKVRARMADRAARRVAVTLPKCTCESAGTPQGCPVHWGP